MAAKGRQLPARPPAEDLDTDNTLRKTVWSPPPNVRTLMDKVGRVEERLEHLETLIGLKGDDDTIRKEQAELQKSRADVDNMKKQLQEAVKRLEEREQELADTRSKVDNLTNDAVANKEKISKLEVEKKELQQLVQELETRLNERSRKITRLEKTINDMQRALNNTNNQVASLQAQMAQMQEFQRQFQETMAASAHPAQRPQVPPLVQASSPTPLESAHRSRQPMRSLGLPPIEIPRQSSRGSRMNFPPQQKK